MGRPLPRGAAGVSRVPDDLEVTPAQALDEAQRLLDESRPFMAHEVLEAAWKSTTGPERELWQGLAQVAVGLTHAQRGNAKGARALLDRGAERVAAFRTDPPHGIDAAGVVVFAQTLSARIGEHGLDGVVKSNLTVQLRGERQASDS